MAIDHLNIAQKLGISERELLDFCASLAVAAGLEETAANKVAQALDERTKTEEGARLYPVIWLEGASCSGCTESFAQLATPGVATALLEMLSLNYSDVFAAGAGASVIASKEATMAAGDYLLVYEGAVPLAFEGNALRAAGKPGTEELLEAASNAKAVIALGSCAVNGGWMAAPPNPTGATGVQEFISSRGLSVPVINIPGCPGNPEWLLGVLVRLVLLKEDAICGLDKFNKPAKVFGDTVHDNCSRRPYFERGEFAATFGCEGDDGHFCLYGLGCQGPKTRALCPITLWNSRKSWCVYSGGPCIGCCDATPGAPSWVQQNGGFVGQNRRAMDFHVEIFKRPLEANPRIKGESWEAAFAMKPL